MKNWFAIIMSLSLLCLACRKTEPVETVIDPSRTSTVTISLSTKADRGAMDQEDSYDGHAFHNVLVIIADPNNGNRVVDSKFIDEIPDGQGGHEHWSDTTVVFERIQIGSYKVYAYANIDHTAEQDPNNLIEDNEGRLNKGEVLPTNDRQIIRFTGTDIPGPVRFDGQKRRGTSGILMTGFSDLDVGVIESSGTVELSRLVSRLNVYINNHGSSSLYLKNLHFSDFNASDSYLLGRRLPNGKPDIPSNNFYRPLPAFDSTVEGAPIEVLANGRDSLVYSANIYENARTLDDNGDPFEYRIFCEAEMNGVTKTLHIKDVELLSYDFINNMSVGQVDTVIMVCPKRGQGKIINSHGSKAGNMNGGNKEYVTNFIKAYAEDTNFIFYLKKEDDTYYTFYKDCVNGVYQNPLSVSNVSLFSLEQGRFVNNTNAQNCTSFDFTADDLCNFKSPGNKYLQHNNGVLRIQSLSTSDVNCQWALFKPRIEEGSIMKLVDNKTSQVSVLDCMFRNQELNVILNVYYNEVQGEFDFYVDNTYWGSTPHEIGHIFK